MADNQKSPNLHDAVAREEQLVADLERQLQERKNRLALVKEFRDEMVLAGHEEPEAILPPESPTNGRNPAYAPKGRISGTNAAEQYLRERGKKDSMANVHRGALALGADLTYTALHQMISAKAKKRKTFSKERGQVGLLEWNRPGRLERVNTV